MKNAPSFVKSMQTCSVGVGFSLGQMRDNQSAINGAKSNTGSQTKQRKLEQMRDNQSAINDAKSNTGSQTKHRKSISI